MHAVQTTDEQSLMPPRPAALAPTDLIDSAHPSVVALAAAVLQGAHGVAQLTAANDQAKAMALYLAVRDRFRYDPYSADLSASGMRASTVIANGHGWCVPKAALLAALCRASGIPAQVGFADVRNHLSTARLRKQMGTDVFYWHGYTAIWLQGRWVKATPAFNRELTERFGLLPLEFDGEHDSLYHPYDRAGQRHMEYVNQRGQFDEVPLAHIVADFKRLYPRGLGQSGAKAAQAGAKPDFHAEAQREQRA